MRSHSQPPAPIPKSGLTFSCQFNSARAERLLCTRRDAQGVRGPLHCRGPWLALAAAGFHAHGDPEVSVWVTPH